MPPPPPPPPAPVPPRSRAPAPAVPMQKTSTDRGALLASIRAGKQLKKAETNDRSAPVIGNNNKTVSSNGGTVIPTKTGSKGNSIGDAGVNGSVPQLGGLFAGGMPTLRPTRPYGGSNSNKPLLPPGEKPSLHARKHSAHDVRQSNNEKPALLLPGERSSFNIRNPPSPETILHNNGRASPSPKPSFKSNPAPNPPAPESKPTMNLSAVKGPLPDLPNPANKPAPPRPPVDISPPSTKSNHPPLPAKPAPFVKPSSVNKPPPPRPPTAAKPHPPPKSPGVKMNGTTRPGHPPKRASSMRVVSVCDDTVDSSQVSVDDLHSHRRLPDPPLHTEQSRLGVSGSRTVGRTRGQAMIRPLSRPSVPAPPPPSQPLPPPPPPPPSQPPPPPPHRNVPLPPPPSSKPEPPSVPISVPPPPPRGSSMSNRKSDDFENKFAVSFKSPSDFPVPHTYRNGTKTYPSRNDIPFYLHKSYIDLHELAEAKISNSQRRAPPPPPGHPPHSSSLSVLSSSSHTPHAAPPQPPHAPIHLQVGAKMYGAEMSQC